MTATLTLEPPTAVTAVAPASAQGAVQSDPADVARLNAMVGNYLDAVTTLDVHSDAFQGKVHDIENLGDDDIRASASVSNRLLDKPAAAMGQTGISEASSVSKSLLNLRRQVEDLDPSRQGDLLSPHDCWGSSRSATVCGITSTSTSPARRTSTRSSTRSITARMSCAVTTPTSSRRRSTSGRSWGACASTCTWDSSWTRSFRSASRRSRRATPTVPRCSRRICSSRSARRCRTC